MKRAIAICLLALALPMAAFCQADDAPAGPPAGDEADDEGQVVVLRAVWPGADLANASFRVFEDAAMRSVVDIFPAPDGNAMAVLRSGDYYVMAVVDANGNNQVDAGDGFGFHGVSDLSAGSRPQPLEVREGQLNSAVIPILLKRTEEGKLAPLASALERTTGSLTGELKGVSGAGKPTLILALPVGMQTRPVVTIADDDGSFELQAPAGAHTLVALTDADDSGAVSPGDVLGTRGYGEDGPIAVEADATTTLDLITLGGVCAHPGELPPLVAGRITGAQIPEGGRGSVAFCTDQSLRNEAFSVAAGPDGWFAAVPEVGTYYLRATIDEAGDDRLGAGDMMGFHGVTDLVGGGVPQPLIIDDGALRMDIDIAISARINEDGRLSAWAGAADDGE